jgi:hypothetical protein
VEKICIQTPGSKTENHQNKQEILRPTKEKTAEKNNNIKQIFLSNNRDQKAIQYTFTVPREKKNAAIKVCTSQISIPKRLHAYKYYDNWTIKFLTKIISKEYTSVKK